jgi:hypothetical protein
MKGTRSSKSFFHFGIWMWTALNDRSFLMSITRIDWCDDLASVTDALS